MRLKNDQGHRFCITSHFNGFFITLDQNRRHKNSVFLLLIFHSNATRWLFDSFFLTSAAYNRIATILLRIFIEHYSEKPVS